MCILTYPYTYLLLLLCSSKIVGFPHGNIRYWQKHIKEIKYGIMENGSLTTFFLDIFDSINVSLLEMAWALLF